MMFALSPRMSEATRRAIEARLDPREFTRRVARENRKGTVLRGHTSMERVARAVVDLTKSNAAYYRDDAAPNFRFTPSPHADPERLSEALGDLARLGVPADRIGLAA